MTYCSALSCPCIGSAIAPAFQWTHKRTFAWRVVLRIFRLGQRGYPPWLSLSVDTFLDCVQVWTLFLAIASPVTIILLCDILLLNLRTSWIVAGADALALSRRRMFHSTVCWLPSHRRWYMPWLGVYTIGRVYVNGSPVNRQSLPAEVSRKRLGALTRFLHALLVISLCYGVVTSTEISRACT